MNMAVRAMNPFEASFENLTTQVKKTTKQAAQTVVSDVKQQVTGEMPGQPVTNVGLIEQLGLKEVKPEDKEEQEQKNKQLLSQTRQNLEKINQELEEVRRKKAKKEEEAKKVEKQAEEKKVAEKKKKDEDPFWKRMLRGKTGPHEAGKNVAG